MISAIGVSVLIPVLLWAAFRLWVTARRLDRLHKRTEAAWFACEEALGRRIVATRALVATGHLAPRTAEALRTAALSADRAARRDRQAAESRLTRELGDITTAQRGDLIEELADAEERVGLANQFYNDAVRDTRALRASWFTRFFRLAGHARLPEYFGIAAVADDGQPVTR